MSEYSIGLAAMIVAATIALMVVRRRRSRDAPPMGIVLLLSGEKPLDGSAIAAVFGTVTGAQFDVVTPVSGQRPTLSDLPNGNVVLGGPFSFLVQSDGVLFVVNSVPKPYREAGCAKVPEEFDDASAAKAVRENRAWLSAEVLHPEAACAANYRIVARVIAEFMSAECLALFHPESRTLAPVLPAETLARLRSAHPIRAVFGVSHGIAGTPSVPC